MAINIKISASDLKYFGDEPEFDGVPSGAELAVAYNWYNYVCDNDKAKEFVLEHLKEKKIKTVWHYAKRIAPIKLRSIGWNLRILSNGYSLPEDVQKSTFANLIKLVEEEKAKEVPVVEEETNVISIQDRIEKKTQSLIGDLEETLDQLSLTGQTDFDISEWFRSQAIKPQIAKKIGDYYKPIYGEIYDAVNKVDDDLVYAYRKWKKKQLKAYMEFINQIIQVCDTFTVKTPSTRKTRKKKEKPASVIVKKMKYCQNDGGYKSVEPKDIIGAAQLWTYNIKTRQLAVYNARGPAGLSVKGTTIINFDDKTSITKKLRKPQECLKELMDAGKVQLRKIMENLTTQESAANGRINIHTILMRMVK